MDFFFRIHLSHVTFRFHPTALYVSRKLDFSMKKTCIEYPFRKKSSVFYGKLHVCMPTLLITTLLVMSIDISLINNVITRPREYPSFFSLRFKNHELAFILDFRFNLPRDSYTRDEYKNPKRRKIMTNTFCRLT